MITIRPYQQAAIDRLQARPDRRLLLAWDPGAGKTRGAIEIAKAIGAKRILVVASALARPVWRAEFARWWPEVEAHTIRFGKVRKSVTKAQAAERELAYAADVQVTSFALLKNLDGGARDLLILDEVHALRSPLSQQSRMVKAFARAHPGMPILALSATPIPSNVANIWNVIDTLAPAYLGKATKTGDVSWDFRARYMHRTVNDYGTAYSGVKEDALPGLAKRLEPLMHRVTETEFAAFLPPVVASMLFIDEARGDADVAADWLDEQLGNDRTHIGMFPFGHKLHAELVAMAEKSGAENVFSFTGIEPPEERARIIAAARAAPRSVLIATAESVRESVSLSGVKDALILQWRTTPAQALQLFGRFGRADGDKRVTTIKYVAHPGDETRAESLQARLDVSAALYEPGPKAERLQSLFAPRPLTEERLEDMMAQMFGTFNEAAVARVESERLGHDESDED